MIVPAARLALAPLLHLQARRLRESVRELPEPAGPRQGLEDPRRNHGEDPSARPAEDVHARAAAIGLLVVGDSSAAGVGARTQDEALALPLARRLAQRAQRCVRWQLVARTGLTSAAVLQELIAAQVEPADIAVVIVGVNDIARDVSLDAALAARGSIAAWLHASALVRAVLFPALPEMERFPAFPDPLAWYAGQAARRNNRAQLRWAQRRAPAECAIRHVTMDGLMRPELMADDGFHPGPALYGRVVQRLADVILTDVLPALEAGRGRPNALKETA
jgi:lysophospholipase L1-like esterase